MMNRRQFLVAGAMPAPVLMGATVAVDPGKQRAMVPASAGALPDIDADPVVNDPLRQVRVGIIRCDTHAFWYANLFDRPDPEALRTHHRGIHYYFHERDDPTKPRFAPVPGMRVTRVYDEKNPAAAEGVCAALGRRPRICRTLDEVSDDVDLVFLANCNFNGEDHLRKATPVLRKGVPLFVDMPMANTLAEARQMVALAKAHDTALMCGFMLRESPHFARFGERLADIAPVHSVTVPSYGSTLESFGCAITITQRILGDGCRWVQSSGDGAFSCVRLRYGGSPEVDALILHASHAGDRRMTSANYHHCGWRASAYGEGGAIHSPRVDDYLFMYGGVRLAKMAKLMAVTRKPPIPYASMLELMLIAEAARRSHESGTPVELSTL